MHERLTVESAVRRQLLDVTERVRAVVRRSSVAEGLCVVFVPHTTAGVTVNENADPDVCRDLLVGSARLAPEAGDWRHAEGNSDAHLLSSLVGPSLTLVVAGGELVLGTWQGIYFCEFDGPRVRQLHVKVLGE